MSLLDINIKEVKYGDHIVLKKNSISINNCGLYAFFGKNGSGKTTLLKTIAGLKSFEGSINPNNKLKIAWIPTEPLMYDYLKVFEFYNFFKSLNRNRPTQSYIFDIANNKIIKECSTGTRKKIYINTILQFSDYEIYIFDEPFNGLDLESTYIFLDFINKLSETKIVIVSSHIVEIIEDTIKKCFYIENGIINEILIDDLKKWIFSK